MSSRPSAGDGAAPYLFVLTAPSGAGKTTLVHALTARHPDLRFSISYTTRPQRRREVHGADYLFVSEREFMALEAAGELLGHIRAGDIRITIGQRFALEEAAEAHRALESRQTQGCTVLIP